MPRTAGEPEPANAQLVATQKRKKLGMRLSEDTISFASWPMWRCGAWRTSVRLRWGGRGHGHRRRRTLTLMRATTREENHPPRAIVRQRNSPTMPRATTERECPSRVCIRQGAKVRRCGHVGCTNNALKGGVCIAHGAKDPLRP